MELLNLKKPRCTVDLGKWMALRLIHTHHRHKINPYSISFGMVFAMRAIDIKTNSL